MVDNDETYDYQIYQYNLIQLITIRYASRYINLKCSSKVWRQKNVNKEA